MRLTYEELPELLFKESKTYDAVRREFTTIVLLAKEYGFDNYSNIDEHRLTSFLTDKLRRGRVIEQAEVASFVELSGVVFSLCGRGHESVEETIEYAIKMLNILRHLKQMFGSAFITAYEDQFYKES
jgi:hypothetical protein